MKKAPNKPTKHWYKQKDSGPCIQCVLRRHLHMAVTWVTPHPCPFTRPGREAVWGGREAPPSGQGTLRRADRCRLASASSALPTGPPENSGAGSACAPSRSVAPSTAGGGCRLPGPQPSLPSPARLGSAGCTWGGFPPQAAFLHFPVPRISGRGNQAARVFCVCSQGLLSKINTRSSHLHGRGRPRVTTGAWSP